MTHTTGPQRAVVQLIHMYLLLSLSSCAAAGLTRREMTQMTDSLIAQALVIK